MGSPVSALREVFDLTPTETADDWLAIAQRIEAVPHAYEQLLESLRVGMQRRLYAAPRQAAACADQADTWAGTYGEPWFAGYVQAAPAALRPRLDEAARQAAVALAGVARFLRHDYAPAAAASPTRSAPSATPSPFASTRAPGSTWPRATRGRGTNWRASKPT